MYLMSDATLRCDMETRKSFLRLQFFGDASSTKFTPSGILSEDLAFEGFVCEEQFIILLESDGNIRGGETQDKIHWRGSRS